MIEYSPFRSVSLQSLLLPCVLLYIITKSGTNLSTKRGDSLFTPYQ